MRGVRNPEHNPALEAAKRRLEKDLRAGAGGPAADRILRAYLDYYRARGSTYHVKAQQESVALKGKPLPRRAALVEAMFMAELKNLILTAGHDLDGHCCVGSAGGMLKARPRPGIRSPRRVRRTRPPAAGLPAPQRPARNVRAEGSGRTPAPR